MRKASGLPLLVLLLTPLAIPAGAQTFSEATDVVVVEVPVQVIGSDGKPVRGLTADHFEVYEGRRKQSLVGFETLDLASRSAAEGKAAPPPVAARRHFLMMFDFTFSSPAGLTRARDAAQTFVQQLHPSDVVSVASYTADKGTEVLLQFTGDRGQILAGIDRLGLRAFRREDQVPDPLGLIVVDDVFSTVGKSSGTSAGGIDSGEMERVIGNELARTALVTRERSVAHMTRSYAELARMMAGVRGRKYLVLFSEGFDASLLSGTADTDAQLAMAGGEEIWDVNSTSRFGSTKTVSQVEEMLEEFRRADCVIQAVDVAGLRAGVVGHAQFAGGKDSLFLMARETGGELFENTNQLGVAVAKVLERTSVTYVLAFQPDAADVARDGKYHRLDVKLKNGPRGARLVHRPGYYAPQPYGKRSPLEKAFTAGQALVGAEEMNQVRTSVLAAPFPVQDGAWYVPVLIEVDGPSLTAGMKGGALPTDIYAYAFDAEGRVRDFFSQTVGLDLAKVGPALAQGGLKFFGHLDLPPGEWSVRVLVRNGATGAMGLQVATVHVPELAQAGAVLLPAFFPEPQGKWLIVREAARQGDREVPYPFMLGSQPYVPASMPLLAAGQGTSVSLIGYRLKPGALRAEARVLTADGREAGAGAIEGFERLDPAADGSDRMVATFAPPAGLQPGDYMLMVTVTDSAGAPHTSVTPFQVAGIN
jgi:VWFA-related protein